MHTGFYNFAMLLYVIVITRREINKVILTVFTQNTVRSCVVRSDYLTWLMQYIDRYRRFKIYLKNNLISLTHTHRALNYHLTYWVPQKLLQIYNVIAFIFIGKVA